MSKCGFPDGYIHMHMERCYQGGYRDGYLAGLADGKAEAQESDDVEQ